MRTSRYTGRSSMQHALDGNSNATKMESWYSFLQRLTGTDTTQPRTPSAGTGKLKRPSDAIDEPGTSNHKAKAQRRFGSTSRPLTNPNDVDKTSRTDLPSRQTTRADPGKENSRSHNLRPKLGINDQLNTANTDASTRPQPSNPPFRPPIAKTNVRSSPRKSNKSRSADGPVQRSNVNAPLDEHQHPEEADSGDRFNGITVAKYAQAQATRHEGNPAASIFDVQGNQVYAYVVLDESHQGVHSRSRALPKEKQDHSHGAGKLQSARQSGGTLQISPMRSAKQRSRATNVNIGDNDDDNDRERLDGERKAHPVAQVSRIQPESPGSNDDENSPIFVEAESSDGEASAAENRPGINGQSATYGADYLARRWEGLDSVFSLTKNITLPLDFKRLQRKYKDVWKLKLHCDFTKAKITEHESDAERAVSGEILSDEFREIETAIAELCNDQSSIQNKQKAEFIRRCLVPSLVELISGLQAYYGELDRPQALPTRISISHLDHINSVIGNILTLDGTYVESAPKKFIRTKLKSIHQAFAKTVDRQKRTEAARARLEQEVVASALEPVAEDKRANQTSAIRRKWEDLHLDRLDAEGGIILDPVKRNYLAMPRHVAHVYRHGRRFELVHTSQPVPFGPFPAAVEDARRREWAEEEMDALYEGLQRYSGPLVFERIIREHCVKQGMLNRFSVTDIVTRAADFKQEFASDLDLHEGADEEWFRRIPVWTDPGGVTKAAIFLED